MHLKVSRDTPSKCKLTTFGCQHKKVQLNPVVILSVCVISFSEIGRGERYDNFLSKAYYKNQRM